MEHRMATPHQHHSIPPVLPPANCFTIYVIDDLAPNRKLLGKFLKAAGYAVVEATNGVEALEALRDGTVRPDLIVTDVEMPVMNGITLVEQIRYLENGVAGIPIITASGNADDDMRREALAVGSDTFLTKPFDLKELRDEIANLLRTRRRSTTLGTAEPRNANRLDTELKLNS